LKQAEKPPSEELVEKVIRICQIKDAVNWKYRGKFNNYGIMAKRHVMKKRRRTSYRVSGKFLPMLLFLEDWRNTGKPLILVKKYKPGKWEQKLDLLYEFSEKFREENRDNPHVFSSTIIG
jgi:hypothetical protein